MYLNKVSLGCETQWSRETVRNIHQAQPQTYLVGSLGGWGREKHLAVLLGDLVRITIAFVVDMFDVPGNTGAIRKLMFEWPCSCWSFLPGRLEGTVWGSM